MSREEVTRTIVADVPGIRMYTIHGGCHCGGVQFSAELSQAPASYNPRVCDCDFCQKHGAAYVSDPSGYLRITLTSESNARRYRQGSGAAEFLICANCGVLVTALYRLDATTYGAINAKATSSATVFGESKPVSPKTLPPTEKAQRWQSMWFRNVDVGAPDPGRTLPRSE
jgi:hypothetical protein